MGLILGVSVHSGAELRTVYNNDNNSNMTRYFIILTTFLIVAILVTLLWSREQSISPDSFGTDRPVFSTTTDSVPAEIPEQSIVRTQDGDTFDVEEFIKHPDTERITDVLYTVSDPSDAYVIYYNRLAQVIFIHLYDEALSDTRRFAEAKLQEILSQSRTELCDMNIEVTTTPFVNPSFAGRNLRLSFCPYASLLPQ